ncbi:MAG: glycosyltransferase family 9 protein [Bacteroidales bacterium]|nr:glycosyltransferase family 9 protein [Bacteroidales bacterium]
MNKILISRTDSIGDVMLTLPLCGWIKEHLPESELVFLGKNYTRAIAASCTHIDQFISWDELSTMSQTDQINLLRQHNCDAVIHVFPKKSIAKLTAKAGIPLRIGATGRWYHFLYCNKLIPLTRRRSDRHEAQLNIALAQGLGINTAVSLDDIHNYYGFVPATSLPEEFDTLLQADKIKLILHPRSKGSAREWGLDNFKTLIRLLPESKYQLFISGSEAEELEGWINGLPDHVINLCGRMKLETFIAFIAHADGLIAASTGPLHIAAALNKIALGIYPPMHPIHPGRWAPLGQKAAFLVKPGSCDDCRKNKKCHCITEITPEAVVEQLNHLLK